MPTMVKSDKNDGKKSVDLNELIGQFGPYHVNVMLFCFLREATISIDSIALSLSIHPDIDFQCIPSTGDEKLDLGCEYFDTNGTAAPCLNWKYSDASLEGTLTVEYDLICDRKMLAPLLLTSYYIGALFGNFIWGNLSDKLGRWRAHAICHSVALLFSLAGLFSPSIYLLMLTRFGTAFGATGSGIQNTVQIEMIGTRYRAFATVANHCGWGFGIMLVALIGIQTNKWRYIAAICPVLMSIGLPWLLILPDSIRWLKVHGKHEAARKEIRRAAKYNFVKARKDADFDSKIDHYLTTDIDNTKASPDDSRKKSASVLDLFRHSLFCFNLVTLWMSLCFSGYTYYSRTIHFSKDHKSLVANFIFSGSSELIGLGISLGFMLMFKRKTCIALFNCLTDFIAKICAINGIIILFLVAYEVFPTELRDRGASIILTGCAFGGILAPFKPTILESVGGDLNYSLMIAGISLALSSALILLVTETKDVDVTDTIEESTDKHANRRECKSPRNN